MPCTKSYTVSSTIFYSRPLYHYQSGGGFFFLWRSLLIFFGPLYISGAKRSHRDTELCKRLVFVNIYCTITLEVIVLLGAERQDICSGPLSIVATKLLSARCNLMLNWAGMNPNLIWG